MAARITLIIYRDAYTTVTIRRGSPSGTVLNDHDDLIPGETLYFVFSLKKSYYRFTNHHITDGATTNYAASGYFNVSSFPGSSSRHFVYASAEGEDARPERGVYISADEYSIVSVYNASRGKYLSDGDKFREGENVRATISGKPGYELVSSTLNGVAWISGTLDTTRDANFTATSRLATYHLSVRSTFNGVNVNVLRSDSPLGGGDSGLLRNGDAIYYDDALKLSFSVIGSATLKTAAVNGEDVSQQNPYSFSVKGDTAIVILVDTVAVVYIGNTPYQIYIGDGSEWKQYKAYIGDGSDYIGY